MDVSQLQRQLVDYTKSLYREEYLDSQFQQLQQLQDESSPEFVVEVVSLFFDDSQKIISDLSTVLHQQCVDFKKVDAYVHQLKGSSSSIGAHKVKNACIEFRNYCDMQNINACLGCLQQVKHEYLAVKSKLDGLFTLERKIIAAGGSLPTVDIK